MQEALNHLKMIDFGNLFFMVVLGRRRGLKLQDAFIECYLNLILLISLLYLLRMNYYPRSMYESRQALSVYLELEKRSNGFV